MAPMPGMLGGVSALRLVQPGPTGGVVLSWADKWSVFDTVPTAGPIHRNGSSHWEVMPPSAVITDPVRNDDSSPARNSATCAISSGVPSRPIGYFATVIARPF